MSVQFQAAMKLCSLFLQYPNAEWVKDEEIKVLFDFLEENEIKESLLTFNGYLAKHTVDHLCEQYVNTFDFSEKATLYMTFYQYQDQRERGEALLHLKEQYNKARLELDSTELPDYLPMILEFIAIASLEQTQELMQIQVGNMKKLQEELIKNNNPYKYVLQAALSGIQSVIHSNLPEFGGVSS